MAKRKRRRTKKGNFELAIELYAVILVIIAILGIGKLGPVGKMIASFSLFLTGSICSKFCKIKEVCILQKEQGNLDKNNTEDISAISKINFKFPFLCKKGKILS